MDPDLIYILWWWFVFLFISVISFPLTWYFFRKFFDVGYGFTKSIGLLIISYIVFLLGIAKIAPFTETTILISLLIFIAGNIYIFAKNKNKITKDISRAKKIIIAQESLFSIGFLYWSMVRGHQPDINGLEKFMDLGFINSILRTTYLPPPDMWFAGSPINYYWFGHFTIAVITKLSLVPSTVTYNLALATIMGLTLIGAFSVSTTLFTSVSKTKKRYAIAAGLISALLLTFAGNFHPLFFHGRIVYQNTLSKIECSKDPNCTTPTLNEDTYWYPDATRFIGYDPETEDKTIHEFPMYSFVVSDLHAHLLNLPFVLLIIAFLARYALTKTKSLYRSAINILPVGFLIGIFFMTNAWDVANYLLVAGVLLGLTSLHKNLVEGERGIMSAFGKTIFETTVLLISICFLAIVVVFPFVINFESIAQGVGAVNARTPFWQLLVLWGLPLILFTTLVTVLVAKTKKLSDIKPADIFAFSLLVASLALIIIPEIIFVKDIYIASHHRANTMFKLTYQAFVVSYLVSGYVAIRAVTVANSKVVKIITIIFFGLVFSTLLQYPRFSTDSYYNKLKEYKGISGDTWLAERYPSEYKAVRWLNRNVKGQPIILEAPGDSYTDYNMISAYTGLPTVSGWYVHEWLWRGDASFPQERVNDIVIIYTSGDIELTQKLLEKYNVQYVIIGTLERQKYPNIYEGKFSKLGKSVFQSGAVNIYKLIE